MRLGNYILNTIEKIFYRSDICYTSINEMPIWNWNEILLSGDIRFIFKRCDGKIMPSTHELWFILQDQYIEEFGLEDNTKKRIKLLKEKARLNYEFILTGDRFINTLLSIVDVDLSELNKGEGVKFYTLKDHLEKYKGGVRIDPKITTVTEWFTALKNMTNG